MKTPAIALITLALTATNVYALDEAANDFEDGIVVPMSITMREKAPGVTCTWNPIQGDLTVIDTGTVLGHIQCNDPTKTHVIAGLVDGNSLGERSMTGVNSGTKLNYIASIAGGGTLEYRNSHGGAIVTGMGAALDLKKTGAGTITITAITSEAIVPDTYNGTIMIGTWLK